ncbi:hypothetical protein CEXT_781681 [Caerostris extrusa]|uniref:Uncharacterized protein n=1 Tax=Caerostris extrusa TaxID=172846 RepID=A0AAV4XJ33_CAEEX|nr:hypothetical protein CEXT_781681 [Caerostris extrusa]
MDYKQSTRSSLTLGPIIFEGRFRWGGAAWTNGGLESRQCYGMPQTTRKHSDTRQDSEPDVVLPGQGKSQRRV